MNGQRGSPCLGVMDTSTWRQLFQAGQKAIYNKDDVVRLNAPPRARLAGAPCKGKAQSWPLSMLSSPPLADPA